MKIDEGIKKQAENLYRSGNHSGREIARMLKIGETTLRGWARAEGWKKERVQEKISESAQKKCAGRRLRGCPRESDVNGDLEKTQRTTSAASPIMFETLVCEICGQELAMFDPEKVSLPLRREMFEPINPDLGLPPSWQDPSIFEWRCFYGHPPFLTGFNSVDEVDPLKWPARLKTPDGYIEI